MRVWLALAARCRSLVLRRRREADLAEELRLHVDREVERRVAEGVPAGEARRLALVAFGGVEQIKEACRDARGASLLDDVIRDTRHAIRRLVRDWRFSCGAVLILGLGIGANTAIFSVINTALFRDQSYEEPDRLVEIYQNYGDARFPLGTSYPASQDIAAYRDVFESVTAVSTFPLAVGYQDDAAGVRPASVQYATASYLSVLGLRPSMGRWFDETEDVEGAQIVAVIGHRSWSTRFGGDSSVLGRTIRINGAPVTIVGIGPERHNSAINAGVVADFWLPITAMPVLGAPPLALERRPEEPFLVVKARLREGLGVAQAQAAMDGLGARLAADYPDEDPGQGITVLAADEVRIHPQIDAALKPGAAVLLIVVGLVLAIACSNLATLLLVRGVARSKEVSVRLALGASRIQLVRSLLTESLVLSTAGGGAGCLLAWWAVRSLGTLELPLIVDLTLDLRVLVFAVGLSLVTGVAFGLVPALKATRFDLLSALRDEGEALSLGRRWFSVKNGLLVFQVASSFLFLAGTSLFLQVLGAARTQNLSFSVDGVAMIETDGRYAGYDADRGRALYEQLERRVAELPGVESTALNVGAPMRTTGGAFMIDAGQASGQEVAVLSWIWAGPGFFETLQIPLLAGRAFGDQDRRNTPRVAVINESMARRYFGGVDAIGRRFRPDADRNAWYEVVGVVRNTGTADLSDDLVTGQRPLFFRSYTQSDAAASTVVARTTLDGAGLVGAMQRELRRIDVGLPVVSARTMAQHLEGSLLPSKVGAGLLGGLGVLGMALAAIGLYAVVAFAVSRRSREVGIRMALGARSQQVIWLVAREVAALVSAGVALGMALSIAGIGFLKLVTVSAPNVQLYRPSIDPVALGTIALLMAGAGVTAAYFPARRAGRANPLVALRHD